MVEFSYGNQKLRELARHLELPLKAVVGFDLPAGWTCPNADICKTKSDPVTGKITRYGAVMCYAAKVEAYAPPARRLRWRNFNALTACPDSAAMADLIDESLPKTVKIVRIHSSGDFFSPAYFQAWRGVAYRHPEITFYGYTKILAYAMHKNSELDNFFGLPELDNFYLQYSHGSRDDCKVASDTVPTCYIEEYDKQYPEIQAVCGSHETSHQDYLAIIAKQSFKIKLH